MPFSADPRKDYFEYLENVLGIKALLTNGFAEASIPPLRQTELSTELFELLIAVENYASYTADEIDLLQKMIAAVKVDPSRYFIVDLAEEKSFRKKATILFKDEMSAFEFDAELVVQAYSPRVLLNRPELKKVAWTELQKVLQFFT